MPPWTPSTARAAPTPDVAVVAPGCSQRGCATQDGVECAYVDRRGQRCPTAWCLDHRVNVEGVAYCVRHAGIVHTVLGSDQPPPDHANRAPSLASWVARHIEEDVTCFLQAAISKHPDLRLVSEPVRLVFRGPQRVRSWQRTWRFVGHVGVAYWVEVSVDEDRDREVVVRVNHDELLRTVPPWIALRNTGDTVSRERDLALRQRFHDDLVDAVKQGLEQARPLV